MTFENLPFRSIPDKPVFVDLFAPITLKVSIPVYLTAEIMGIDEGDALTVNLVEKSTENAVIK